MKALKQLRGIQDLKPAPEVIGAVVTVGRKALGVEKVTRKDRSGRTYEAWGEKNETGKWVPAGTPIFKDRLRIARKRTVRDERTKVDYRPDHPRFEMFNAYAGTIYFAELCYGEEAEFFDIGYLCYRGPKQANVINPRHRGPWCHGNGTEAERWNGKEYSKIDLCGRGCPFYTDKAESARFYFRPRWEPFDLRLPRPPMKLASKGREARESFEGMLRKVEAAAAGLGIEIRSWLGFPFSFELSMGRSAARGTAYPEISFSPDEDFIAWLQWQDQLRKQLEASDHLMLGAASEAEREPEVVGDDHTAIVPTIAKPAAVAKPPEDVIDVEPQGVTLSDKIAIRVRDLLGLVAGQKATPSDSARINKALRQADILGGQAQWHKITEGDWDGINRVLTEEFSP